MRTTRPLLPVVKTIKSSWKNVKGAKATFWIAIGISILITLGIGILSGIFSHVSYFISGIINLFGQIVSSLISIGLLYIGIQRAKTAPINYKQIFDVFNWPMILKIFGVYFIQFLIVLPIALVFGLLPLLIFGNQLDNIFAEFSLASCLSTGWFLIGTLLTIYVTLRFLLSMAFVLDQKIDSWSAVKMSFAVTKDNELRLLAILVFQMVVIIIGAIPFGIGLIWAVPFSFITYGMTYKNLALNNNT